MSVLDDARDYVDLPKKMQDDDALRFARAVISLYELLDNKKSQFERERQQRFDEMNPPRCVICVVPLVNDACPNGHPRVRAQGSCGKWRVGQSGPCVYEDGHDGECLGRTGAAMGG